MPFPHTPCREGHCFLPMDKRVEQKKTQLPLWLLPIAYCAAFVALAWLFLYERNADVLYYMQERSYWNNSMQYFLECVRFPGGFLSWTGSYLTQYFYYPACGVAVLTGVWMAAFWVAKFSLRVRHEWSFLLLVPLIALLCTNIQLDRWVYFLKDIDYCFYHSLGILAALLLSLDVTVALPHKYRTSGRYAQIALVSVLAYYPLGVYAFVSTFIIAVGMLRKEPKGGALGILLAALLWGMVPVLETGSCTLMRPDERWLYGLKRFELATLRDSTRELPFWLAFISAMLLPLLQDVKRQLSTRFSLMVAFCSLPFALGAYMAADAYDSKDVSFHSELRMQNAVQQQRWDDVLREFTTARTTPTREMVLFRDIALMNKGELFSRYNYNNQTVGRVVLSDSILVRLCDQAGDLIYYNYGETNFGIRRNIERTMHFGYSYYSMKFLAECALVNGEYDVARKYADILGRSTFQRKWAKEFLPYLQDTTAIADSPRFGLVRKMFRQGSSLIGTDDNYVEHTLITKMAHWACYDPQLQDIALMYALQEKNPEIFWSQLQQFLTISPERALPRCIQEAAVFYRLQLQTGPDLSILPIEQEVINTYHDFMKDVRTYASQGMNAEAIGSLLRSRYGTTYFWDFCTLTEVEMH